MNDKQKKLLALYNDSSITIEEKRTIAVKLIDLGILEYSAPKKEYENNYFFEYKREALINIENVKLIEFIKNQYSNLTDESRKLFKEKQNLEQELEYETKIKSRLKLIFILLIVIDIIIIFTH